MVPTRCGHYPCLGDLSGQQIRERAARFERGPMLKKLKFEAQVGGGQPEIRRIDLDDRSPPDVGPDQPLCSGYGASACMHSYEEFEAEAKDMTADGTVVEIEESGGTALGIEVDVRDNVRTRFRVRDGAGCWVCRGGLPCRLYLDEPIIGRRHPARSPHPLRD